VYLHTTMNEEISNESKMVTLTSSPVASATAQTEIEDDWETLKPLSRSVLPTKALSLKQPWAWAVLHGKDIENRRWNTKFRGWFWLHAAKSCTTSYYLDALSYIEQVSDLDVPAIRDLELGGIIGKARIVEVLPKTNTPTTKWHMPGQYGFVLENIQAVPFTPCSGALNFWNVSEDLLEKLSCL